MPDDPNHGLSSERKNELYDLVGQIHLAHPLTSRDLDHLAEIGRRRAAEIGRHLANAAEHAYAGLLGEQRVRREVDGLPPLSTPPVELWHVERTDDVLGGMIELGATISQHGKTAIVRKATSRQIDASLVIKYLAPNKIEDNYLRIGLALKELQNLFKVRHPNVVDVYEAGWLRSPTGERSPFVMMEELDGCTLQEWATNRLANQSDPLGVRHTAAAIALVLGKTVQFLHRPLDKQQRPRKPLYHLDLKPSNVIVVGGESAQANASTLKIIDFGSFGSSSGPHHVGTPPYMAPERFLSEPGSPDATWDVYSLGGILYFLVIGTHPLSSGAASPDTWNQWWDEIDLGDGDLTLVCKRALARHPDQRYQTAAALNQDIAAWLTGHPLMHARDDYTWFAREILLWKRSRHGDDIADHEQIVARAALVLAAIAGVNGLAHPIQVAAGVLPVVACHRSNTPVLIAALCLLAGVGYAVGWRVPSVKILEPMFAMVISFFCLMFFAVPDRYFSIPTWHEQNVAGLIALMIVGIVNIAFASLSPEWKIVRPLGWGILFLTFFLRPLFDSSWSPIAMPVVVAVVETGLCLVYSSRLNGRSRALSKE